MCSSTAALARRVCTCRRSNWAGAVSWNRPSARRWATRCCAGPGTAPGRSSPGLNKARAAALAALKHAFATFLHCYAVGSCYAVARVSQSCACSSARRRTWQVKAAPHHHSPGERWCCTARVCHDRPLPGWAAYHDELIH
eukprot:3129992-Rhodomonas_salina.2